MTTRNFKIGPAAAEQDDGRQKRAERQPPIEATHAYLREDRNSESACAESVVCGNGPSPPPASLSVPIWQSKRRKCAGQRAIGFRRQMRKTAAKAAETAYSVPRFSPPCLLIIAAKTLNGMLLETKRTEPSPISSIAPEG